MKIKVSELTGAALDWAVAKCEGHLEPTKYYDRMLPRVVVCDRTICDETVVRWNPMPDVYYEAQYTPSTNWAHGGPIIEREEIELTFDRAGETDTLWRSEMFDMEGVSIAHEYGPTPLIAAMRCYVASKLGDTIDVPEELK
jgi:hypothetical protein